MQSSSLISALLFGTHNLPRSEGRVIRFDVPVEELKVVQPNEARRSIMELMKSKAVPFTIDDIVLSTGLKRPMVTSSIRFLVNAELVRKTSVKSSAAEFSLVTCFRTFTPTGQM